MPIPIRKLDHSNSPACGIARMTRIEAHPGHGLTFDHVAASAVIGVLRVLNIGHFFIGEAIVTGLAPVVKRMGRIMAEALNRLAANS